MALARYLLQFGARKAFLATKSVARTTETAQRWFQLSSIRNESQLAKLRKKTGYAFAMCRKALELHQDNLGEAEKWLRAEAAKQGWAKAERVKSRSTGEGLVGIYTSPDQTMAAMVEVKCETDFVAKNEHFLKLVTQLAQQFAQRQQQSLTTAPHDLMINKVWLNDASKLDEIGGNLIRDAIIKLGENIRFVRGCLVRINPSHKEGRLFPYTHSVSGKLPSPDESVKLGKYGTIVAIRQDGEIKTEAMEDESMFASNLEELGSKLGQHIIGLSPTTVKHEQNIHAQTEKDAVGDEEPTVLVKQKFIFNEDITVGQFLANSNATVLDFVRFECGEESEV